MSDACLERREKAKPIVDNLYVLWLGVANIKNISKDRHDMYCSITGEGVANRLSGAKFFKTKKEANLFYKIYELKYKGLKVLQVKDLNMKTYHGRKGI